MGIVIDIPQEVLDLLRRLNQHGFAAYVVGGCVRDSLLGKTPSDWDVTTAALPEQVKASLGGIPVLETGLQHGTVTALQNGKPVEITTFRTDGTYTDHRRPDGVTFTRSLEEDLARRDFTINAMAYHPGHGLVDSFHGREDLDAGVLRCVGDPRQRFAEDALRIFRTLRFASTLGFSVEPNTAHAVREQAPLLHHVAAERLQTELMKLLGGTGCETVLREFAPVLLELLPELAPMVGCAQNHPYHTYSVWEHTLHAVGAMEPQPLLRLTMLLHDSGKPACKTTDAQGIDHFKGHASVSVTIAKTILKRLKFSRHTQEQIPLLVKYHDLPLQTDIPWMKRQLNRFGEEAFSQLLSIHRADILAQNPALIARTAMVEECRQRMREILEQQACFSLRRLAIKGKDLLDLGIPQGKEIGVLLQQLLVEVIDGTCANTRPALLQRAQQLQASGHSREEK